MTVFITGYERRGNSDIKNENEKIRSFIWQCTSRLFRKKTFCFQKILSFRVKFQNSSGGSYYTSFCSILATESRGHNFKIIKRHLTNISSWYRQTKSNNMSFFPIFRNFKPTAGPPNLVQIILFYTHLKAQISCFIMAREQIN